MFSSSPLNIEKKIIASQYIFFFFRTALEKICDVIMSCIVLCSVCLVFI